jgi:DNA-binding PadR family transcriptional regulator
MPADRTELLQGTLEMLVLRTLAIEPMHGWGIAHRIEHMSADVSSSPKDRSTPPSFA